MGDSPAFRFYPADWLVGTLTFSLAEEGAYLRLVMHQWNTGGVPGDDFGALSRIMRVTPAETRKIWPRISSKFVRDPEGVWRNARIELERAKQEEYRRSKAAAGRRGGVAKAKQTPSTATVLLQANDKQTPSKEPSKDVANPGYSFSSSLSETPSKNDGAVRGGGLVASSLDFEKLKRFNAYVGTRLRVPHKLHNDFVAALGGESPDAALRAWYADIDAEIEVSKEPIIPDVWKWLEARFKPWAMNATTDAAMAKWAEGA